MICSPLSWCRNCWHFYVFRRIECKLNVFAVTFTSKTNGNKTSSVVPEHQLCVLAGVTVTSLITWHCKYKCGSTVTGKKGALHRTVNPPPLIQRMTGEEWKHVDVWVNFRFKSLTPGCDRTHCMWYINLRYWSVLSQTSEAVSSLLWTIFLQRFVTRIAERNMNP